MIEIISLINHQMMDTYLFLMDRELYLDSKETKLVLVLIHHMLTGETLLLH